MHKSTHLISVVISDGHDPRQTSTGTLTIRVCTCNRDGNMVMCNAEALTSSAGLSTGALVAILLCLLILLRKSPSLLSFDFNSQNTSTSICLMATSSIRLSAVNLTVHLSSHLLVRLYSSFSHLSSCQLALLSALPFD